MTAECEQKASAFESRQQLRAEEITAVEKAIEILSSGAVAGNAEKHLPGLLQVKKSSLAQLRASNMSPAQQLGLTNAQLIFDVFPPYIPLAYIPVFPS